ncbi:MAG: hypothetical protein GX675_03680 [Erysipelotrichaceae bacterium]|nr:hypothetical protein [Erysipelotrichaceae bacterium]
MLTFKVLDTLKPSDDVLEMITNTKPTYIKVNNGKTILIERTNIKSIEPIIYELTYDTKKIILWEYPISEIRGNHFYIPITKETYSFKEVRKLLSQY